MPMDNQLLSFIAHVESSMNEQKENFWSTSRYLSEMVFCDPDDCLVIAHLLQQTK